MLKALFKLLENFAKGGINSWMIHAGITAVVFSGLDILITEALDYAINGLDGLPADALQLALLCGISEFFSIIGSALLTRVALVMATQSMGLSYKGKGAA